MEPTTSETRISPEEFTAALVSQCKNELGIELEQDQWTRFSENLQQIVAGQDVLIHNSGLSSAANKKAKFDALADEWHQATRLHSSIALKAMHPAYQKIIGMGKEALPYIFDRLQAGTGHWFWALTSITGAMPIPQEDLGRVPKMREHWIQWGQKNGYVGSR